MLWSQETCKTAIVTSVMSDAKKQSDKVDSKLFRKHWEEINH